MAVTSVGFEVKFALKQACAPSVMTLAFRPFITFLTYGCHCHAGASSPDAMKASILVHVDFRSCLALASPYSVRLTTYRTHTIQKKSVTWSDYLALHSKSATMNVISHFPSFILTNYSADQNFN